MGGRWLVGVTAMVMLWANGCSSLGVGEGTDAPSLPDRGPVPAPLTAFTPGWEDLDAESVAWVEETLASLSLRQQIAQLVIQWLPGSYASTSSPEFLEWAGWVRDDEIGGIYLSIGLPHSYAAKINELQARARVPLLVTSDFENGGPGMRINHSYALPSLLPQGGGTSFPPTMALGAIGDERFVREFARITALEARAVGVHLNFAPVLDVNSNPDNPVINTRSFGENPASVALFGAAYIEGAHEGGVLVTAKHFPGHGDTQSDSHVDLPIVPADWDRLNAVELVPFRMAVDVGVDAVMTAHVVVSGVQGLDGPPATLDSRFMTELLREDMGFEGLLFTDALVMGALSDRYGSREVAVRALEAGSDVLLMPTDVTEAIDAVQAAVRDGRIDPARIRVSARRVLETKARAGVHKNRMVDLDAVDDLVGTADHLAFADTVATRSMTLLRDRDGVVPIGTTWTRKVFSLTYARSDDLVAGTVFDQALLDRGQRVESARVGPDAPGETYDSLSLAAQDSDLVLINVYVPPRAGVGDVTVSDDLVDFVEEMAARRPLVVTSFGNPYLVAALPDARSYLIAWGDHEVSQTAAARALLGETAITGRLPISIPPFYRAGDGLERRAAPTAVGVTAPGVEVDPETVGMDADRLRVLDGILNEAVADSASPGAALAVGRHGKLVRLRGYGRLDWAESAALADPRSIYDLASLTKVTGTTTAAMILVDEERLELDAPVVDYLPWWAAGDPAKEAVTVRQLLLHRAGLPPFRQFYLEIEGRTAYQEAIAGLGLEYAAGSSTVYSDIGLMTLAFIVEEVSGRPLDVFLRERVWEPQGMTDTDFRPARALRDRIAPTELDTFFRNTHVHGVVHDENAYAMGGVAGHAGLFSTASDLAILAQTLLGGGIIEGCFGSATDAICAPGRGGSFHLVSEETLREFTSRFDASSSRGLGWDTPGERSSSGDYFTRASFGHTGFTGTSIWIDPELDLFVVLLTNRVNPTRDNARHVQLRRMVHDVVALAITDQEVARRDR